MFQTQWCRGLGGEWQTGVICATCGAGYPENLDEIFMEGNRLFSGCDHCGQKTEIDCLPPHQPAEVR